MKKKKGISLILLIVTIIVIIILAVTVILTVTKNNPIESAKEAVFKEDVRSYQDELNMYISKEYTSLQGNRDNKITAKEYGKNGEKNSVYTYVPDFKKKYEGKIAIKEDMIAYVGIDEKEKEWLLNSGVYMAKTLTVKYVDQDGNKLKDNTSVAVMDNYYSVDVPEIEGYVRFSEKLEGNILQDSEVVAEYYLENDNLAFTGLNSSGKETTDEASIVSYEVTGIGDCNVSKIAIPREHNAKPVTTIKSNAFSINTTLQSVIIEDNIKSIGTYAFASCKNLEQVSINASSISSEVFKFDNKLKRVIIGKNVSVIKEYIFNGCSNIDDLTILTEKANISNLNIAAGNLLKEVKINDDNSKYTVEDGVLFSKDGTKIYAYPTGKIGDTYIIPKSVTTIVKGTFTRNSYLKYIDVPDTVTSIGAAAFSCDIKELKVNINWLSDEAIRGCSNLEKITIGKNLKGMGGSVFNGTNKLQSITYLGTVEEWNKIMEKNTSWRGGNTSIKKIICSDGEIIL